MRDNCKSGYILGAIIGAFISGIFLLGNNVLGSYLAVHPNVWNALTPSVTATVPPRPTATRSVRVDPLLYYDALDNSSTQRADWQRFDVGGFKCFFASDGYHASIMTKFPARSICHQSSHRAFQDFNLTVDVVLQNNFGGVLFRDQAVFGKVGAYLFEISANGRYRISAFSSRLLVNWTLSPAIRQGNNARNTLQVTAYGYVLRFYVNGIYLVGFKDRQFTSGGVSFIDYPSREAVFSNLYIYR